MRRMAVSVIMLCVLFAACGTDGAKKYSLTVGAVEGTAMLSPAGGRYAEGAVVSVRVYPRTGFAFSAWEGDVVSTDEVLMITMNSNISNDTHFHYIESGNFRVAYFLHPLPNRCCRKSRVWI